MKDKTEDIARELLLSGKRINKFDFINICGSTCLPQRIKDIRYKSDWDIQYRSVPGKGTLREYWLEPEEIARIRGNFKAKMERIKEDEQLTTADKNNVETASNKPRIEQMGLGLPGGHNYQ